MRRVFVFFVMVLAGFSVFAQKGLDVQGHRGCRGLLPENTIPSFLLAIDLGANTIELDVVISADRQVVISHEHYMNWVTCLDPSGQRIPKDKQKDYNIYQMTVEQIRQFDCGSIPHPDFPDQKQMSATKPLFSEMIDAVEKHLQENNLPPVNYNIEIKCSESGDNIYHPDPKTIVDLVMAVTTEKGINQRMNIQSFDPRPLQYLHQKHPEIRIAYLVSNVKGLKKNIDELGFTPQVYSPYHMLVTKKTVRQAHSRGMLLIPWTVNKRADMEKLIALGVDGIITDYPDKLQDY
ncbi:MAG: glycerophosphodiester phosphodiesterase [Bacteroidales bacterium]|nr:glycerophosphodiester phosphodiesterase [Bacteroidales bacterium]MDD2571612.1 glycerophosphodiester phosphodiesterase [Bacteroidales bacterium]MDD2813967.1 glycerophosphodiester phosphodiesterase [Bacteroidales bacterium]MDD3384106.1 glycerophosphodiester phosphodiesterase [Bacteroidales bacterium]MDD3812287.1 glycerophosphodiester phosphodiesterase [Bacteroidales bacterium]